MTSLEKWNERRREQYRAQRTATDIACPKCGEELHDTEPGCELLSAPPQMRVHCPKCGFVGLRVV